VTGPGPRFDPDNGTLVASARDLRALVAGDLSRPVLRTVGAVRGAAVHPRLAPILDAIRDPCAGTLQLSYAGRALDGWRGADVDALLTPPDADGHHSLVGVPPTRLSAALARVAALVDRPWPPRPTTLHALRRAPDLQRWWRLIHSPTSASSGGLLEVVDTLEGLFLVDDDGRAVPTDAGAVRHLIRWLVGGQPVLVPLRALPDHAALPVAAG
jgi:hypothetical protein